MQCGTHTNVGQPQKSHKINKTVRLTGWAEAIITKINSFYLLRALSLFQRVRVCLVFPPRRSPMQFLRCKYCVVIFCACIHASFKCAQIAEREGERKRSCLSMMQCHWFEIMVRYVCYRSRFLLTVRMRTTKNSFSNGHQAVKMRTAINRTLRSLHYSQRFSLQKLQKTNYNW